MYLEVSSRQCGKTKRLIHDIFQYIVSGKLKEAIVIVHNSRTRDYFIEWVNRNRQTEYSELSGSDLYTQAKMYCHQTFNEKFFKGRVFHAPRFYFDEFDFFGRKFNENFFKNYDEGRISLDQCYFVTTPSKIRNSEVLDDKEYTLQNAIEDNDLLIWLLKKNAWLFSKCIAYNRCEYIAKSWGKEALEKERGNFIRYKNHIDVI